MEEKKKKDYVPSMIVILHWVVRQYDIVFLKGIFLENPMVLLYREI